MVGSMVPLDSISSSSLSKHEDCSKVRERGAGSLAPFPSHFGIHGVLSSKVEEGLHLKEKVAGFLAASPTLSHEGLPLVKGEEKTPHGSNLGCRDLESPPLSPASVAREASSLLAKLEALEAIAKERGIRFEDHPIWAQCSLDLEELEEGEAQASPCGPSMAALEAIPSRLEEGDDPAFQVAAGGLLSGSAATGGLAPGSAAQPALSGALAQLVAENGQAKSASAFLQPGLSLFGTALCQLSSNDQQPSQSQLLSAGLKKGSPQQAARRAARPAGAEKLPEEGEAPALAAGGLLSGFAASGGLASGSAAQPALSGAQAQLVAENGQAKAASASLQPGLPPFGPALCQPLSFVQQPPQSQLLSAGLKQGAPKQAVRRAARPAGVDLQLFPASQASSRPPQGPPAIPLPSSSPLPQSKASLESSFAANEPSHSLLAYQALTRVQNYNL